MVDSKCSMISGRPSKGFSKLGGCDLSCINERSIEKFGRKALNILVNERRPEIIKDVLLLCKVSKAKASIELRRRLNFILNGYEKIGEKSTGKSVYYTRRLNDKELVSVKYIDRAKLQPRLKLVLDGITIQYAKEEKEEKDVLKDICLLYTSPSPRDCS